MAVRYEFLGRNARATHFGNLDLVPSASTPASRLLPSSPLKRPDDRPGNCARRIPVGRTKERRFHRREILGNHRRQSQESRLELRPYLKYGSQRATILGLAAEREDAGRPTVHAD